MTAATTRTKTDGGGTHGLREPVAVLDRSRWARQALFFDALALIVLLLAALGLGLDLYIAGHLSARTGALPPNPDFAVPVRLGLEAVAAMASFAWIAARLLRAGYRALPGSG